MTERSEVISWLMTERSEVIDWLSPPGHGVAERSEATA
jgi:hypothetical protein